MILQLEPTTCALHCRRSIYGRPRAATTPVPSLRHVTKPRTTALARKASVQSPESEPGVEGLGPGGGFGANGGNNGGHGRPDWSDGGKEDDDGDYFGAWMVLVLAAIPYGIDGARRLSFGKDGIRILNLPAEPGMSKPIFAAAAIGQTIEKAPDPRPQSMSSSGGGGGASFVGVLALALLCAGGYYFVIQKKRRRGPPGNDEELQIDSGVATNTRSLDPSLFQRPLPEGQSQDASSSSNPLVSSMDEKDATFGMVFNSTTGMGLPDPFKDHAPPETAAPPAVYEPKHLSPEEVVKDHSSSEPSALLADLNRSSSSVIEDLPSKDRFFGTRSDEVKAPLQPASDKNGAKEKPESQEKKDTPNEMNEHLQTKDAFFGIPDSNVNMAPVKPEGFGSVAVPKAPSPLVHDINTPQSPPSKVVQVHDTLEQAQKMGQDTEVKDVLEKDLNEKDAVFGGSKVAVPEATGSESIMKVVSDPIMGDIAEELEEKVDEQKLVQVGLGVDGEKVSLSIGASGGPPASGAAESGAPESGPSNEAPVPANGGENEADAQVSEKKGKKKKKKKYSKGKKK